MPSTSQGTFPDISIGTRDRVPSRRDARGLINLAFTNSLPKHRFTAKEIADEIGAAENTVEGWRAPEGVMSAEFLMILQVKYPHFEAELRRLFKLQRELDPDFPRQFAELLRRVL